jgi:hypothetical protein
MNALAGLPNTEYGGSEIPMMASFEEFECFIRGELSAFVLSLVVFTSFSENEPSREGVGATGLHTFAAVALLTKPNSGTINTKVR